MSNLVNDLDKFLKTDGLRILIESGAVRTEPYEPLTVDDIDDFAEMGWKTRPQKILNSCWTGRRISWMNWKMTSPMTAVKNTISGKTDSPKPKISSTASRAAWMNRKTTMRSNEPPHFFCFQTRRIPISSLCCTPSVTDIFPIFCRSASTAASILSCFSRTLPVSFFSPIRSNRSSCSVA